MEKKDTTTALRTRALCPTRKHINQAADDRFGSVFKLHHFFPLQN
jgi:hypothetical protein